MRRAYLITALVPMLLSSCAGPAITQLDADIANANAAKTVACYNAQMQAAWKPDAFADAKDQALIIMATCAKIYSYASLRNRVVLAALQELHGDWLTDQVGMPVPPQDNCAELEAEVFTLREEVERLRRDTDTPAPASCPQASRLLDLALDVIRGKITGLSADQIETLRGIS